MVDFAKLLQQQRWYDEPFVALDFETTGLDPYKDRVIEIGIARFERAQCVQQISRFVHPGFDPRFIDRKALKVNHIQPEQLMGAPPFWQVYNDVAPLLYGARALAFNAPFDRAFLLHEVSRCWPRSAFAELPPALTTDRWIDPCAMARSVFELWRYDLANVAKSCGIALRDKHEARNDAVTAGEIAVMLGRTRPIAFGDLERLFNVQREASSVRAAEKATKAKPNSLPKGSYTAFECDVCFKVEAPTTASDLPQGWGNFRHGNLTTCGPACDMIAGWWAQRW